VQENATAEGVKRMTDEPKVWVAPSLADEVFEAELRCNCGCDAQQGAGAGASVI